MRRCDNAVLIPGRGAAAYLDIAAMIAVARGNGCDAVHPGYGFLSENVDFAHACAAAGLTFVGPSAAALELFGNKVKARALAEQCGVPVIAGTKGATSLEGVRAFMELLGPGGAIMIKAVAGGGGRGMRAVEDAAQLEEAYARAKSEAQAAFGAGDVYAERLIRDARHIEVQIVGDRQGAITAIGERECTIQRRNQKLIEIAPSPSLSPGERVRLSDAAKTLAEAARYHNLGTFEFLLDASPPDDPNAIAFIEANPRLQVEHTITEEIFGIDLVKAQLRIAGGELLADIGLAQKMIHEPRGYAMQQRINMEMMDASGATQPTGGTLAVFEPPSGPGIRVDTFGYAGYRTSAAFDSLLAKLIVHSPSPRYEDVCVKAQRALREFRIEGVATNLPFLQALLADEDFRANRINTRFVEERIASLVARANEALPPLYFGEDTPAGAPEALKTRRAELPPGAVAVNAPLHGTLVSIDVLYGDAVRPGQAVGVIEAMKMEHLVAAPQAGIVRAIVAGVGLTMMAGEPILFIEPAEIVEHAQEESSDIDLDAIRHDHAELIARHANTLDESRPDAVARRRKTNQRTARENIAQLCDPGSFIEYGALAIAAQRRRRPLDDLIRNTPADGLIAGVGTVNADAFRRGGCALHGARVRLHRACRHPGTYEPQEDRPDARRSPSSGAFPSCFSPKAAAAGRATPTGSASRDSTVLLSCSSRKLSALVPLVGIVSGYCFAGNAALLGCCDVIIATKDSSIGMGGPAMIEGGGLGVYHAGPKSGRSSVQAPNGVIDVLVEDEAEASTRRAKQYLSYFQGARAIGARRTSASCAVRSPRTGCASTTSATSSTASRMRAPCWNSGAISASA